MEKINCYAVGICAMSVCVPKDMSKEEIIRQANIERPTGIKHQWAFSEAPTFKTGDPNPCACNTNPQTHLHYLLEC